MTKQITNKQYGDFARAVRALGDNVASIGDVIYDRNNTPIGEGSWNQYGWTREARLIAPKNPVILVRNSPLLDLETATKAVEANKQGSLFYMPEEYVKQLDIAEQDMNKPFAERRAMLSPSRDGFKITPASNFEVLAFYAGEREAEKYLNLLEKIGINELDFYLPSSKGVDENHSEAYVQQSWLGDLAYWSVLGGVGDLDYYCWTFGVRSVSGEATQKIPRVKNSELPYTPKQLEKAISSAQQVREGTKAAKSLDKVIEFLQSLRQE